MKQQHEFTETEIGKIPGDWGVATIEGIKASKKHALAMGPFGSNITKDNFVESGVPVIRGNNLTEYRFLDKDFVFVTESKADELAASVALPEDIVITHRGSLGQVGIIPKKSKYRQYIVSQSGMKISCDTSIVNPQFVFYFLKSPSGQYLLLRNTSQTGVPAIAQPLASLRSVPIPLPEMDEQNLIVRVLSTLDDLIELNHKMNATLEKIGQAIFKRWFIDFEFPNENGKPYKSSGGEMVDFELGEMPKAWKVREINDCGKVVCGKTPPTQNKEYYGKDIPFVTIPDMRDNVFVIKTERSLSEAGASSQSKKELPAFAVCVSCIATPGLVSLTSQKSHTNQQINSIICNEEISPYFIFFSMRNKSEDIKTMGLGGTATLNLNTGDFSKIKLVVPDQRIMMKFHNLLNPLFSGIKNNMKEVLALFDLRDSLLPRLMSGKIRVRMQ